MKLKIIGDGAFGSFFKELLTPHFEICDDANSIVLAVPISAYESIAKENEGKHLINVCSVQKPTTDICLKYTDEVTSIHPLFGRRTPKEKRNCILTYSYLLAREDNDTWWYPNSNNEHEFVDGLSYVSTLMSNNSETGMRFTPESHDILMAKTHLSAIMAAKQLKVFVDRAKDVPDCLIPNSFRLMREFVKTLEDMPEGTVESILANPYA